MPDVEEEEILVRKKFKVRSSALKGLGKGEKMLSCEMSNVNGGCHLLVLKRNLIRQVGRRTWWRRRGESGKEGGHR